MNEVEVLLESDPLIDEITLNGALDVALSLNNIESILNSDDSLNALTKLVKQIIDFSSEIESEADLEP